jgi:hypothetical protein
MSKVEGDMVIKCAFFKSFGMRCHNINSISQCFSTFPMWQHIKIYGTPNYVIVNLCKMQTVYIIILYTFHLYYTFTLHRINLTD